MTAEFVCPLMVDIKEGTVNVDLTTKPIHRRKSRKQVPKVTNGKQQPTSRVENLSVDFRIW